MKFLFLAQLLSKELGGWEKRSKVCFPSFLAQEMCLSLFMVTGIFFNIFHCIFPQLFLLLPQAIIPCPTCSQSYPQQSSLWKGPLFWEGNTWLIFFVFFCQIISLTALARGTCCPEALFGIPYCSVAYVLPLTYILFQVCGVFLAPLVLVKEQGLESCIFCSDFSLFLLEPRFLQYKFQIIISVVLTLCYPRTFSKS